MNHLKFPVGIPDLKTIREDGYYYVDKTPHIRRLIDHGRNFFLSRPRRFGKSLLLDTIQELFEGNETLFKGLDICSHWDWSTRHPVVRLSFDVNYNESWKLESHIKKQLARLAKATEIDLDVSSGTGPELLEYVLYELHAKTRQQVVVLVDEYDKPILDAIEQSELARTNRDYLRDFYGVIKGSAKHVRFVFVTGISMFSKVSLFSGLNNLKDISLDPRFATICGYTDHDLETVFAPELENFDRDEIRRWYKGYNWCGDEKVYNPYDVLLLFDTQEFGSHWFKTGTPTFLYRVMLQHQFNLINVENMQVEKGFISSFDVGDIAPTALMFQAGYLTIVEQKRMGSKTLFTLDYPNLEVREDLSQGYLEHISEESAQVAIRALEIGDLLIANDFDGFLAKLRILFAGIPYHWQKGKADLARYEAWYASLLYACFQARGFDVKAEEATSDGRSDLVVSHGSQVFVFELKVVRDKEKLDEAAAAAIEQIGERGYGDKYRDPKKVSHLIGLAFSRSSGNKLAVAIKVDHSDPFE